MKLWPPTEKVTLPTSSAPQNPTEIDALRAQNATKFSAELYTLLAVKIQEFDYLLLRFSKLRKLSRCPRTRFNLSRAMLGRTCIPEPDWPTPILQSINVPMCLSHGLQRLDRHTRDLVPFHP
jgi:hypothetical protein